ASTDEFRQRRTFEPSRQVDQSNFNCPICLGRLKISSKLNLCPPARVSPQQKRTDDIADFIASPFMCRPRSVSNQTVVRLYANQHRVSFNNRSFATPESHSQGLR